MLLKRYFDSGFPYDKYDLSHRRQFLEYNPETVFFVFQEKFSFFMSIKKHLRLRCLLDYFTFLEDLDLASDF